MSHSIDESILEPFTYLSAVPGKDVRGCLIDCFQQWLRIPESEISVIKEIIASLHNASLLVDDIEDNSKMRRGVPVAHAIYGIASTINCANYVYFLALEKCQSLKNSEAMQLFISEMLNLHRGQGQDILWREAATCPTEDQYRQMICDKTGGLFRLAVGLMQCFSENKNNFRKLLDLLGLYFQIRDDYLNLSSSKYMQTKSFCEDLTEGKFSFPIIHAIHSQIHDKRLLNILKQRTEDVNLKTYAVKFLEDNGSLDYTRRVLSELYQSVLDEIRVLGGHEMLEALLNELESQLDRETSVDNVSNASQRMMTNTVHISNKITNNSHKNSNIISTL